MSLNDQIHSVYYTRMFQALPGLVPLQQECGGDIVIGRPSAVRSFKKVYPSIPYTRHFQQLKGLKANRLLQSADYIFAGAGYPELLDYPGKKIMTFHGTLGLMDAEGWGVYKGFDHLCLIGPRMEHQLLRCNDQYQYSYSVTGFLPFAMYPEKTPDTREKLLKKLKLNPEKKTVVYTPSKASVGTWIQCAEDIARETPRSFNLVLRPHPNQARSKKKSDIVVLKKIKQVLQDRPNSIMDLTICSLPELECVADVLISDANSPSEESLYYDCAQLFADANRSGRQAFRERFEELDMCEEDTTGYLQLFDCGPNFYADGYNDWGKAIHMALENKDGYAAARSKCFGYIFGEGDQNAPRRVSKNLKSLFQE